MWNKTKKHNTHFLLQCGCDRVEKVWFDHARRKKRRSERDKLLKRLNILVRNISQKNPLLQMNE